MQVGTVGIRRLQVRRLRIVLWGVARHADNRLLALRCRGVTSICEMLRDIGIRALVMEDITLRICRTCNRHVLLLVLIEISELIALRYDRLLVPLYCGCIYELGGAG